MNKIIIFILSIVCIIACNSRSKTESAGKGTSDSPALLPAAVAGWKFDSLTIGRRVHIDNDTAKDGMKIAIGFVYPVSVPDNVDLEKVQNSFSRFFLGRKDFTGTPQGAFNELLELYVSDGEMYANYYKKGEASTSVSLSSYQSSSACHIYTENEYLITLEEYNSTYTGGAHGLFNYSYLNIDKRNGEEITENKLFKPGYEDRLAALIQQVIEKRNESPDEFTHIDLLVDLKEVKPNQNFYFTQEGITYEYNIYEITPYSQGDVGVLLPYKQVLPLINETYLPLVQSLVK